MKNIKIYSGVLVVLILCGAGYAYHRSRTMEKSTVLPPQLDQAFCDSLLEEPSDENMDSNEYTSPGFCRISIGKDIDLIVSFESTTTDSGGEPVFSVNLYDGNNLFLQNLPFDYSWQYNTDTINFSDDINFDGYKDLLLRVFGPRASEYSYFVYNPVDKDFVPDPTLYAIFTPTFDAKAKTITTTPDIPNYYTDANGDQQYYTPEEQTTVYEFKNGGYVEKDK